MEAIGRHGLRLCILADQEVEGGRNQGIPRSERFCTRVPGLGVEVVGDEAHSLGFSWGRVQGMKQEVFMDMLWILDVF